MAVSHAGYCHWLNDDYLAVPAVVGPAFSPKLHFSGVFVPLGDTLKYPCISW